jgi:vacuolar-type H+-ATPase subunit E/Vma4
MGETEIIRALEQDAAAEVDRLLADADREAARIVAAATIDVRTSVEAAVARAEPQVRAESRRRANAARRRLNERRQELALARVSEVRDAAACRLEAIADGADPCRWAAALGRLVEEALGLTGPGATVAVRQRDAAIVADVVARHGGIVEAVTDAAPAGVLARSADDRVDVDASIPVRLDHAWVRLAGSVATRLGLGT